jgi:hypothetical protein
MLFRNRRHFRVLQIVEQRHHHGQVTDSTAVARLAVKRPDRAQRGDLYLRRAFRCSDAPGLRAGPRPVERDPPTKNLMPPQKNCVRKRRPPVPGWEGGAFATDRQPRRRSRSRRCSSSNGAGTEHCRVIDGS